LETIRTRAKDQLPSVLLTLLSIIQALAIELLWTRLHETPYLWEAGWSSVIGWTQVAAMLLGIFQIWLFYTSLVMRFRWVPSIRDSALPFVIGILEFTLIDLMGSAYFPAWFCTLALIFGVSVWTGQTIFRRARQDPENPALRDGEHTLAGVPGPVVRNRSVGAPDPRDQPILGAFDDGVSFLTEDRGSDCREPGQPHVDPRRTLAWGFPG
jgi:hypothetical protein